MSHVSALPEATGGGIASGLDQTAEAAQYALSTLSDLENSDVIDAAVGVVSAVALLRVLYGFLGRPNIGIPLRWLVALARNRRAEDSCN